jgi:hypothetical protein
MNANHRTLQFTAVFTFLASLGFWACNSAAPARINTKDGSPAAGSGGTAGSGAGSSGNKADAGLGAGGAVAGSGGTLVVDAPVSTGSGGSQTPGGSQTGGQLGAGGIHASGGTMATSGTLGSGGKTTSGTGGSYVDGGAHDSNGELGAGGSTIDGGAHGSGGRIGTGGMVGSGGATGIDSGTLFICGGSCPTGQFCDMIDRCGTTIDGGGHCKPTGPSVACISDYQPVCGCNGKTYPSDCDRVAAGVSKFTDGQCMGGRDGGTSSRAGFGLTWQAARSGAANGPEIVVAGTGWYAASTSAPWADLPDWALNVSNPSYGLSNAQLDDLAVRLEALDLSVLPHPSASPANCSAKLSFTTCTGCTGGTISYSAAAQLAPEMERVWAWFDQVLGSSSAATNPRNYCAN